MTSGTALLLCDLFAASTNSKCGILNYLCQVHEFLKYSELKQGVGCVSLSRFKGDTPDFINYLNKCKLNVRYTLLLVGGRSIFFLVQKLRLIRFV